MHLNNCTNFTLSTVKISICLTIRKFACVSQKFSRVFVVIGLVFNEQLIQLDGLGDSSSDDDNQDDDDDDDDDDNDEANDDAAAEEEVRFRFRF